MRHLVKSLLIALVLTVGTISSFIILTRYSFLGTGINTITLWCILILFAAIWIAFAAEVLEYRRDKVMFYVKKFTGPLAETITRAIDTYAPAEAAAEPEPAETAAPEAAPETDGEAVSLPVEPALEDDEDDEDESAEDEIPSAFERELEEKKLHRIQEKLDLLMEKQAREKPDEQCLHRMQKLAEVRDELSRRLEEEEKQAEHSESAE